MTTKKRTQTSLPIVKAGTSSHGINKTPRKRGKASGKRVKKSGTSTNG